MAEAFSMHRKERGSSLAGASSRTVWGARRGVAEGGRPGREWTGKVTGNVA